MFSVIIPLYNKSPYILRCLTSVFKQKYKDFEVIVVNDGSTDDGPKLVRTHFPNVNLVNQKNQGVSAARNVGISIASNEYIAFLDADDAWHPDYLDYVFKVIQGNIDVKIIGTHYSSQKNILDCNSIRLDYNTITDYFKEAIKNTLFTSSSSIVKKAVIDKYTLTFNTYLKAGEDLDFWFRVNIADGKAFYIQNTLVYYSDEDVLQATRTLPKLKQTLIGTALLIYKPYFDNNKSLEHFIVSYVLFNLYPYYYHYRYNVEAKEIYKEIKGKHFFIRIVYGLPFRIGFQIINNPRSKRLLRLYLKFVLTYIVQ